MTDLHHPEDVAAYNERSLRTLARALDFSEGQFSLLLAHCNYTNLRERMVQRLRELCPIEIRELVLDESATTLYTIIQAEIGSEQPQALMILGLESVAAIEQVLKSANQMRDEFPKSFSFPLVCWVNDQILASLTQLAPDFKSWAATPIEFLLATEELVDFIKQNTERIFATVLDASAGQFLPHSVILSSRERLELESALRDLVSRSQQLDPALEASLQFVLGRYGYASDRIDGALDYYQRSLEFWQRSGDLERQGAVLFHIGLCYCHKANQHRADSYRHWQEAKDYFQRCINVFEQAQRPDLVAKFIGQMGDVLRRLESWDELQTLAQKSLALHQIDGNRAALAQDYGFLTEVALRQSKPEEAEQLAQQALQVLASVPTQQGQQYGIYLLLLATAQQQLGRFDEAITNLEKARKDNTPQYDPQLYIQILEELKLLYFNQGQYLAAFRIKQEQRSIEQQYGFRAFIGAGRLQPQQQVKSVLAQSVQPGSIAPEIITSGREKDVNQLIARISSTQHKLTVIYGQSGVGKSSLVNAGVAPALLAKTVEARNVLPIVLSIYTDWTKSLGGKLADQLQNIKHLRLPTVLDSIDLILNELQQSGERNLLTVLIFDQFEEFFFICKERAKRQLFFEFLRDCLNIPFVKVILSMRDDYLYLLLECSRHTDLDAIDNNILDKHILYPIGNLSIPDAKTVLRSLAERFQLDWELSLVDEIVRELAFELGEVRPIELQVVGAQLQTEDIKTLEEYRIIGSKAELVRRFLEEVVQDCGPPHERIARLVLYFLTDENNTRPPKTRAEIAADLATDLEKLDLVLEIFVRSGLVSLLPEAPDNRYQLIHDYLVTFIRKQKEAELIAELDKERNRRKLTEEALDRVEQAHQILIRAQQRSNQTIRIGFQILTDLVRKAIAGLVIVSAIAAVVVVVAGILALYAEAQRRSAKKDELVALSAASVERLASHQELDGLIKAISAGKQLQRTTWAQSDISTRLRVTAALQQAVYEGRERNRLEGHTDWVSGVSFSPDGNFIASASYDKTVRLWRRDGHSIRVLTGHNDRVTFVTFSPDSKLLASASADKTFKLYSTDGTLLRTFTGHSDWVTEVSFSPDGQFLASSSRDRTVKLWSIDGKLLKTLNGHGGFVNSVSFSPNGTTFASASDDDTIRLWRSDGTLLKTLKKNRITGLKGFNCVRFSPDGQFLASAGDDGTVGIWNIITGKVLQIDQLFRGHSQPIYSISFSRDGQLLASASEDTTVKLWSLGDKSATGVKLVQTLQGHGAQVTDVSFSPDSKTLASASNDKTIRIWDIDSTRETQQEGGVYTVSFSPDGRMFGSGDFEGKIKLWRREGVADKSLVKMIAGHEVTINAVSFSPDGKMLASASDDKTIKLWRVADGTLLQTLAGHTDRVTSVSFSPDGQILASGSADRMIKLWRVADGTLLQTLRGHTDEVTTVSFSPDGQMLASGGNTEDKTVKLWKLHPKLGKEATIIQTFKEHTSAIASLAFSPDGKILATASWDNKIKLWNIAKATLINTLAGHSGRLTSISFSSDGELLVSSSADKTIKFWNVADGTELRTLIEQPDEVHSLTLSPDDKALLTTDEQTGVRLWNLDLDDLLHRGCDRAQDYLRTNPNLSQSDRNLCKNP